MKKNTHKYKLKKIAVLSLFLLVYSVPVFGEENHPLTPQAVTPPLSTTRISEVPTTTEKPALTTETPVVNPTTEVTTTTLAPRIEAPKTTTTNSTTSATTTTISKQKEAAEKTNAIVRVVHPKVSSTTFDVIVQGQRETRKIKSVRVAVWSVDKGQDDLKWYHLPVKNQSGKLTVDIANHANKSDDYIVHAYIDYEKIGTIGYDLGKYRIEKPIARYEIQSSFKEQGILLKLATTDAVDYRKIRFAVWSEEKGQDDLKWYSAKSNNEALALYKNHSGLGDYHVHVYLAEKNGLRGLYAGKIKVELPKFQTVITKLNQLQYKIQIKGLPAYLENVKIPVWSNKGGQDDLRWYVSRQQADKSYQVIVNVADHQFDLGSYQAHLYATNRLGRKMVGLGVTKGFSVSDIGKPSAKVQVTNIDMNRLRFDVIVSNVVAPGGLKSIQVPVWSEEKGQDDLRWYTAIRQNNGTYKVTVDIASHRYSFGHYHAHVYFNLKNGQSVGVATTRTHIARPNNLTTISTSYAGTGNYLLNFNRVATGGHIKYAVWSAVGGQNDLRWYSAVRQNGTTFTGRFNSQSHSGTGTYHIHLYEEVNGQMRGLATGTVHVAKDRFQAPYYSQRDGRWSGILFGRGYFGPSGCVPTTMAMIISGIKGGRVTPIDVGSYLYHHTLEFNRGFFGTSSRGVVFAARNWGLRTEVQYSLQAVTNTLQQGYFVAAAVGPSKFIAHGGHELVLKGYSNGNTYVLDPYNPANNGWYSLAYLWSIQSTDPIDLTEGRPFFKVTD